MSVDWQLSEMPARLWAAFDRCVQKGRQLHIKSKQPLLTFFRRRCLPPAQMAICAAPATVNTSAGKHWVPMEKKICKMPKLWRGGLLCL